MRDDLGNLARFYTVIERKVEMVGHLDRLVAPDQSGDCYNAAIPWREPKAFP